MADSLKSIVENLPDTADGIAAYLEGQGIKGWRASVAGCPLSNFIKQHGYEMAGVCFNIIATEKTQDDFLHVWQSCEHTKATMRFVGNFDKGLYPQLEK